MTAERDGDQGPRRVSHVDEIAAGFEVAGDEGQGVGRPGGKLRGELAEGLGGGEARADRVEHAADHDLQRRALGQARRPWPATCCGRRLDRVAGMRLVHRQVGRGHRTQLGRRAGERHAHRPVQRPQRH